MDILFIPWGIESMDILWGLIENGIEPDIYEGVIEVQNYNQNQKDKLLNFLSDKNYNMIITYYFMPVISDVCQKKAIKYISWIVDSPQIELYMRQVHNDYNYIFLFDKAQYERLKEKGIRYLYHTPLATNIARADLIQMNESDIEKYSCDISFVGNLYENNHYNNEVHKFADDIKKSLDEIIIENALHWGDEYSVFNTLSDELSNQLSQYAKPWDIYSIDNKYFHEIYYLARKVTEIDRVCILNALGIYYKVDLFTKSSTYALEPNIRVHHAVSYEEEAPKVFRLSKINLNITMRTIETGVPQRVMDIMGAGGFVISNYQKELEELFIPDEEIVFFEDVEDLMEKVSYYLTHEEERTRIANKGYQKVSEKYSYKIAVKKIIETVNR